MKPANKLINETSPYLLQHAYNPVNWYPWGEEALQKAKEENKSILVSIGYAACHWCHVMEKESFEDETTAKFMNENFVCIKIDREERPDIDHIYMDAVQAMTGSGGWPLNVFLTPDTKPFYGGTYFPPRRAYNRPSWMEVLESVAKAFNEKREEINAQSENLTEHLFQSNSFGLGIKKDETVFQRNNLGELFQNSMKQADKEWGGFGRAPKFPQTFTIQFLLRYNSITGNEEALNQALLSLDKMMEGGIYDQVGGGFARYATDNEWLVPHFEKMLYDNALLVSVLSEAYQLTQKTRYKEVISETMDFITRELLHPEKGFYSALDADSEGEEGKFYIWKQEEVKKILGDEANVFCQYFDITERGNWSEMSARTPMDTPSEEGKNILRQTTTFENFAIEQNIPVDILKNRIKSAKKKLLNERNKRIRPLLDDKIILGWNALMNIACCKAFAATGNEQYRQLAIANMIFLLDKFKTQNQEQYFHTWKNDIAKHPAFLDDYAYLIQALLYLQEITADPQWLVKARSIAEFVIENFSEEGTGFFFFTNAKQKDVIIRKKEIYDGAVPSGNAIMAYNLHQLSILFEKKEWKERSEKMIASLGQAIVRYPTSFGIWACLLLEKIRGTDEIVMTGVDYSSYHIDLLKQYFPHRVLMVTGNPDPAYPLLDGKPVSAGISIWLCKDFVCLPPVTTIKQLISLINRPDKKE